MTKPKRPFNRAGKTQKEEGVAQETEAEKLARQVEMGEVQIGPEAARKIAKRIEDEGGFWGPRKEQQ